LRIAYAIRAGVGTALFALLGCVLFRQALNPGAIIGIPLERCRGRDPQPVRRRPLKPWDPRIYPKDRDASGAPGAQDGHAAGPWWAIFAVAATRPA
jgi:hypothetical protein